MRGLYEMMLGAPSVRGIGVVRSRLGTGGYGGKVWAGKTWACADAANNASAQASVSLFIIVVHLAFAATIVQNISIRSLLETEKRRRLSKRFIADAKHVALYRVVALFRTVAE